VKTCSPADGPGQDEGAIAHHLRAIIEEASELGADRVLDRLGLGDPRPIRSGELRELLQAWRDAKASAWKAVTNGWCAARWRCC
jgi:hypothetical protein